MGKRTNTAVWLDKYNRWQIKVQKDGERKTFTSSTPGRTGQREANAKADAWMDDNISKTSTRMESLIDSYLQTVKLRTSDGNYRNEESRCRVWITPQIGTLKVANLTEQRLQDIVDIAYSRGLSKKSLTSLRATIVALIKFCRRCKVTTLYPDDITIPKGARVGQKKILQPDDIVKLFTINTTVFRKKIIHDDYINAYRLQVLTGLRPGELLGLMWSDIEENTVHVQRSINIDGEVTSGKNENAVRSFDLTDTARLVLDEQRLINGKALYVFENIMEDGYRKRFKRYCQSNNISYVTPYEMRHTFVSIAKNLSEGQIKPLLGHSRNMDSFGTYGHELRGERAKTASQLDKLFKDIIFSNHEVG